MANKKKKYVWLGVAGAALATLLVYFSIFWPPVPRSWVQGAIGKRDVYRQDKLTDKDVGVAGTATVTVDDIRAFQQSPEFKALAGNAQFNELVANPEFRRIVQDAGIARQNLGQNARVQTLLSKAQFGILRNDPQFLKLLAMPASNAMMTNNQLTHLAAESRLSSLPGNAAMEQIMTVKPFRK